jgi:hypothetical protein
MKADWREILNPKAGSWFLHRLEFPIGADLANLRELAQRQRGNWKLICFTTSTSFEQGNLIPNSRHGLIYITLAITGKQLATYDLKDMAQLALSKIRASNLLPQPSHLRKWRRAKLKKEKILSLSFAVQDSPRCQTRT